MNDNLIDLTSQLVSIPSWVDESTNEIAIGNFIYDYLVKNTDLQITKEVVVNGRFNILAQNSREIRTLIIGHIDTVPVAGDWTTNPTTPVIKDRQLYGRGATDMKGGVAAMLLAATRQLPSGTALLFYIDEEYDFAGMKQFISDYQNRIKPSVIISLDGSQLEIANGCRGLIEISAEIKGVSCHAATPQNGLNAIEITCQSVSKLKRILAGYSDPELGPTSLNLAKIEGGTAPNVVPDLCRFVLDIRPGTPAVNGAFVTDRLNKIVSGLGGLLVNCQVKFDYGSWLLPKPLWPALKFRSKTLVNPDILTFRCSGKPLANLNA